MKATSEVNSSHAAMWPERIGIINDYVRVPYANGSSFASQYLYREFQDRGHEVTVIGPSDPEATPEELPGNHLCLSSLPLRNHPGVRLALPSRRGLGALKDLNLDLVLGQTGSALAEAGVWLRATQNIPFISVNTVHLPSLYNVILPERVYKNRHVQRIFAQGIMPQVERYAARQYNQGDGLVVLSEGLKTYWLERGVKVPIFVIPRSVSPQIANAGPSADPFPAEAKPGMRLLVVCRQTREKEISRLLEIFADLIAPAAQEATLTLVGDGPDFDTFVAEARRRGVENRTFFMGERPLPEIAAFYQHADLFVYTSLSETYGQVVSEAMYCGLPVIALDDKKGVAQQVRDGQNGLLIETDAGLSQANWRFGKATLELLKDSARRKALGEQARRLTMERANPAHWIQHYYEAFAIAREHCQKHPSQGTARLAVRAESLVRWAGVHLELAGFGLLRPPATLNRHGARHPVWESTAAESRTPGVRRRATPAGADKPPAVDSSSA